MVVFRVLGEVTFGASAMVVGGALRRLPRDFPDWVLAMIYPLSGIDVPGGSGTGCLLQELPMQNQGQAAKTRQEHSERRARAVFRLLIAELSLRRTLAMHSSGQEFQAGAS